MEHNYDVLVIGGGLLGCFAARHLTKYDLRSAVLERREDVCTEISKANTAIVYAGYDTKPGTLKTRLCVQANLDFDTLCEELGVPFSRCGSLMICFGPQGETILRKKLAQGTASGVPGLRLLNHDEVLKLEPNLSPAVHMGLWSPTTGTVNPWELGIAAFENARENGCHFFFGTEVYDIHRTQSGYKVITNNDTFYARGIMNCAGLFADHVNEMVAEPSIRIFPDKGDYQILDTKAKGFIRHIISHEPEEKGKGLTLVPTVDGNLLIGPSVQPDGEKTTYSTTSSGLDFLSSMCRKVVPDLPVQHIIRNFGALRPNPFYVQQAASGEYQRLSREINGFEVTVLQQFPDFFSLIGIKTPGLTCADALGSYVVEQLTAALHISARNPNFSPRRAPIIRVRDLPFDARKQLVADNPSYGRIICRCRGITEGEILEAIHRGAVTVDGIKRRTGISMGRCQGSFCTEHIMELLSRQLRKPIAEVEKDGNGSRMIGGSLHERI